MKQSHGTAVDARRELVAAGYTIAFTAPGQPGLWVNPKTKSRKAIQAVDADWRIVPYPAGGDLV